jgi:hypothetical protein
MNYFSPATAQSRSQDDGEVLINVIVKQAPNGKTVTTVLGLPELYIEANDRTTALAQLQESLEKHLTDVEIVPLAVKLPHQERKNPWLEMAGILKDDPQFEQMLEAIESYRREIDASTPDFSQEQEH